MSLYAELRQHAWLKKLFIARRNTDLLPLAQTILKLSDELTQSHLPALRISADAAAARWQAALAQLPLGRPFAEASLVNGMALIMCSLGEYGQALQLLVDILAAERDVLAERFVDRTALERSEM